MYIKGSKTYTTQNNSYMFRRRGAIFKESKVLRSTSTNAEILELQ
jgi:hypothetical protein